MPAMSSDPSPDWRDFEVEESGTAGGYCECCGTATRSVWGFVTRNGEAVGAYFAAWTQGKPDHGAKFDLILGKWGVSSSNDDRYAVALDFRVLEGLAQFMVVDALNRTIGKRSCWNGSHAFRRDWNIVGASGLRHRGCCLHVR